MKFKYLFQRYFVLLLIIWFITAPRALARIIQPDWLIFACVILGLLVVAFFISPGIIWYYASLLRLNLIKSKSLLERSVKLKPAIPGPYKNLGIFYAREGRWKEAIPLLEKAGKLKKSLYANQSFNTTLAIAYREIGNYEAALSILNNLLTKGYQSAQIYYNLAHTYLKQGNLAEALKAAKKARSLNLNLIEPVLILGRIHFALRDFEAAKTDFEWAISHLTWPVESFYWLGRAEFELDEVEKALKDLKTALERIKEDPLLSDIKVEEVEEWLERARRRTGNGNVTLNDKI